MRLFWLIQKLELVINLNIYLHLFVQRVSFQSICHCWLTVSSAFSPNVSKRRDVGRLLWKKYINVFFLRIQYFSYWIVVSLFLKCFNRFNTWNCLTNIRGRSRPRNLLNFFLSSDVSDLIYLTFRIQNFQKLTVSDVSILVWDLRIIWVVLESGEYFLFSISWLILVPSWLES